MCYLKKAFPLVQDIMEDTMRFKDNTPNANAIVRLQELSLRLKSCFTKDYEEHDKVGGPGDWSMSKDIGQLRRCHPASCHRSHTLPFTHSFMPQTFTKD